MADPDFLQSLVATYRDIFGATPWNEWKICAFCGEKYGRTDVENLASDLCQRCGLGCLMDYHSPARVVERLQAELTMPGSSPFMFVAEAPAPTRDKQILGFTWGFGLPTEDVVDYMIKQYFTDLPENVARHAESSLLHSLAYCCPSGNVTYISEVAMAEGARGSAMLFAQMLRAMAERQDAAGYHGWVLWTSRKSRAFQVTTLLGGVPIYQVDEVIAGDDRLLMAGDCSEFLAVCEKYPADKLLSYFMKTARDLKMAAAGK
jgi:hypothetical protein